MSNKYRLDSLIEEEIVYSVGGLANGFLNIDSSYSLTIDTAVTGRVYKIKIDNILYSYTAIAGDNIQAIRDALYTVITTDENIKFNITKSGVDSLILVGKTKYTYLMLKENSYIIVKNLSGVIVIWYQQDVWGALNQVKPNNPFFVLSINDVFTRVMSEKWKDTLEQWGRSRVCSGNIDFRCFSEYGNFEILQYVIDNIKNGLYKNLIPYTTKIIWYDEYNAISDVSEIEDIQRQLQALTNLKFMFEIIDNLDKEFNIIGWFEQIEFTGTNSENLISVTKTINLGD